MIGMVPLRRYGSVHEVATVVAFLLSDDASYVTGANVEVSGGSVESRSIAPIDPRSPRAVLAAANASRKRLLSRRLGVKTWSNSRNASGAASDLTAN